MENQVPLTQTTENPQNSTIQPKPNKLVINLLLILLFVTIVIACFFAYKTQKLANEMTRLKNTVTNISSDELIKEPVSNWKTYSTDIFSFKYPSNYSIETTKDPELIILSGNVGDRIESIYIDWRETEFSNITIAQEITRMEKKDIINKETQTSFGTDLIVLTDGLLGGSFSTAKGEDRIFIIASKRDRLIKLTTNPPTCELDGYFDQIVTTFEFTD